MNQDFLHDIQIYLDSKNLSFKNISYHKTHHNTDVIVITNTKIRIELEVFNTNEKFNKFDKLDFSFFLDSQFKSATIIDIHGGKRDGRASVAFNILKQYCFDNNISKIRAQLSTCDFRDPVGREKAYKYWGFKGDYQMKKDAMLFKFL